MGSTSHHDSGANAAAGALIGGAIGAMTGASIGHSLIRRSSRLRAQAPQTYQRVEQGQPLGIADVKAMVKPESPTRSSSARFATLAPFIAWSRRTSLTSTTRRQRGRHQLHDQHASTAGTTVTQQRSLWWLNRRHLRGGNGGCRARPRLRLCGGEWAWRGRWVWISGDGYCHRIRAPCGWEGTGHMAARLAARAGPLALNQDHTATTEQRSHLPQGPWR